MGSYWSSTPKGKVQNTPRSGSMLEASSIGKASALSMSGVKSVQQSGK